MFKLNDFGRYMIGLLLYSITSLVLFSALSVFSPLHAGAVQLVGCDIGFSNGSGKPIAMCSNPRYTREELKNFDNM